MPNKKLSKATLIRPGEWKAVYDFDGDWAIFDAKDRLLAVVGSYPQQPNLRETTPAEDAFNAQVMAAAPQLLEALEAIVNSAHNGNEPGQTWVMIAGGLVDVAEAAIRAAKGE
jgi:hypothetical protein